MSLPPFPSQDLAKLVLGYLAEEQLMTVYDEFLQASPYLDALRNEYDRIFMTSLKSILAEYRAVKIYVDTCKPFVLRKKIFQFTSLLDVVKFLIANVDINKIQLQDSTEKASFEKLNVTSTKASTCEVCQATKSSCVCKTNQSDNSVQSENVSHVAGISRENSIETTPLEDLPGSHVTRRKKNVIEKDSNSYCSLSTDTSAKQSFSNTPEDLSKCSDNSQHVNAENSSLNNTVKCVNQSKSSQNIEEFNDVLESVVKKNKTISESESQPNQRISNAGTFQKFASGVTSGQNATYNIPDSSTSENSIVLQTSLAKDVQESAKGPQKNQLLLQLSHINDSIQIQTCRGDLPTITKPPKLVKIQKPKEQKIKILSDIKVGDKKKGRQQTAAKNATSTPLVPMQTIVINGTPAYKHTNTHAYTEDEIMAMPTLIVVPASGPSQIPTSVHCEPIMTHNCNAVSSKNSPSAKMLGPLVIDVPPTTERPVASALPDLSERNAPAPGLVKTVDTKNASVPKDSVITLENNTPQILPPARKSSSTPRRTSHVRVLDFTTPRRILHETINEQASGENADCPVEVVVSGSAEVIAARAASGVAVKSVDSSVRVDENNGSGSAKENEVKKVNPRPKADWDADLRALIGNDVCHNVVRKRRNTKKKKLSEKTAQKEANEGVQSKSRGKNCTKTKKSKNNKKAEDEECGPDNAEHTPPDKEQKRDVPLKPTINVISAHEPREISAENVCNKDDKAEECADTPETERLSLQNVIGAKLNISDIFETPYKQALYDIQMETPKFMDPDFPGEPLSDIKIMNIPTPRFLNTPKFVQATPSSNSSRPTDYSSGGSYYKPDDQDYLPIPEIIMCPVTSTEEDAAQKVDNENDEKKSRPVRKCTKNVSYYRNLGSKAKDSDETTDATSPCSETKSVNISLEFNTKKDPSNKLQRRSKVESQQTQSKSDVTKTTTASRGRGRPPKVAAQDKSKAIVKIKPRHTPKKETPGRLKKRIVGSPYSKGTVNSNRKRTSSKEKVNPAPLVTAMPTKSRRKSSTPRKLHCTKNFNSESSGHDSPEIDTASKSQVNQVKAIVNCEQESDSEHLTLRWSDDGSQDGKTKVTPRNSSANEIEDITKIQEFIDSSVKNAHESGDHVREYASKQGHIIQSEGTLQRDLMKRGFDLETAKIIERDLLDDTPARAEMTSNTRTVSLAVETVAAPESQAPLEKTLETDSSTAELHIDQEEGEDDEVVLSVSECNEGSSNYIVFEHEDTKETIPGPPVVLKDKFTMEVCLDDDLTVRLKATPFSVMVDQDPLTAEQIAYNYRETELAVSSISGMDRLYTPLKESIKAQCYEIFDSTLTSLDTPLKPRSPVKASEISVTRLVLEEHREAISVTEVKKRKRSSVSEEAGSDSKRAKQDADILFQTANIQNIDIESVLTKLHGP